MHSPSVESARRPEAGVEQSRNNRKANAKQLLPICSSSQVRRGQVRLRGLPPFRL